MYAIPIRSTFMMMNATTKVSQIGWSFMYSLAPPSSCRHATAVGCIRARSRTSKGATPQFAAPVRILLCHRSLGSHDHRACDLLRCLAVDRTEHDIDRTDQRHHVCQHRAFGDIRQHSEIHEVWRANPESVWDRGAIGDDIVAIFAFWMLDGEIRFANGRAEPFDDPDEMPLHILGGGHRALMRRNDIGRFVC